MDVPNWLEAVILGIVQGLTEFIPVSSSGHLVIVPALLSWRRPGLAFDVALHVGSAAAVVLYFRAELVALVRGFVRGDRVPGGAQHRRLAWMLVVASVPVAVVGLAVRDLVEGMGETPRAAGVLLMVTAGVLLLGEVVRRRRVTAHAAPHAGHTPRTTPPPATDEQGLPTGASADDPSGITLPELSWRQVVVVGLGQAAALFPGVSRSGTTITAGLLAGMTREAAARFSFLLSLPALLGAAIVSVPDLLEPGVYTYPEIAGGVVAAAISGYLAIRFLVSLVARRGLWVFAVYCAVLSVVTVAAT